METREGQARRIWGLINLMSLLHILLCVIGFYLLGSNPKALTWLLSSFTFLVIIMFAAGKFIKRYFSTVELGNLIGKEKEILLIFSPVTAVLLATLLIFAAS